jgi:anti-sigma factor RsiW
MRARKTSGANPQERGLWRRSQKTDAPFDEAEYLMDLAAFADNRLDDDDASRVAELVARDATAVGDVAAARALTAAEMAADERIVARAAALVDDTRPEALVLAFAPRPPVVRPWYSAATWSGLAAAMVFAGWLGFDLGSGLSSNSPFARSGDDLSASEMLDPAPLMLRDFTENSQI